MLTPVPPTACARARESASARLDGELAELQEAQLEAHLRSCPECHAYAATIGEISRRLSAAPLAQPERPLFVPQRLRRTGFIPAAAAAAAMVVAVAGSSFAVGGMLGGRQSARTPALPTTATSALGGSVDALVLPLLATPGSKASHARSRTIAF
jgi:predicted anti-sigma-YlaC factor YlaD